jgi:hypothetical protein
VKEEGYGEGDREKEREAERKKYDEGVSQSRLASRVEDRS